VSKQLFTAYRVLAPVVGVLLATLVFVGMPLKYLADEGTRLQTFGADVTSVVGVGHGFLYMAYLVVAFLLWRTTRWPLPFAVLVLLAGLIPLVIFWVERSVVRRFREEYPELDPRSTSPVAR
jgi:integral membrane protein